MTSETQIRRRPDGSIDQAFYKARGHAARSEAAMTLARKIRETEVPAPPRPSLLARLFPRLA